jgi:dihydrofolate reductase
MSAHISLIAAVGENLELGADNELLWQLPDDFSWFVDQTKGHTMVMGRKTMQSLGKPLKNRRNLVVSRTHKQLPAGFELFPTLHAAMEEAKKTEQDEIFIIGGGEIYKQSMHLADRLYITRVHASFPLADTFFPAWDASWEVAYFRHHPQDELHAHSFDFIILKKIKPQ